jgi:hypothetical protein
MDFCDICKHEKNVKKAILAQTIQKFKKVRKGIDTVGFKEFNFRG